MELTRNFLPVCSWLQSAAMVIRKNKQPPGWFPNTESQTPILCLPFPHYHHINQKKSPKMRYLSVSHIGVALLTRGAAGGFGGSGAGSCGRVSARGDLTYSRWCRQLAASLSHFHSSLCHYLTRSLIYHHHSFYISFTLCGIIISLNQDMISLTMPS